MQQSTLTRLSSKKGMFNKIIRGLQIRKPKCSRRLKLNSVIRSFSYEKSFISWHVLNWCQTATLFKRLNPCSKNYKKYFVESWNLAFLFIRIWYLCTYVTVQNYEIWEIWMYIVYIAHQKYNFAQPLVRPCIRLDRPKLSTCSYFPFRSISFD